jgi:hypothetical protein
LYGGDRICLNCESQQQQNEQRAKSSHPLCIPLKTGCAGLWP